MGYETEIYLVDKGHDDCLVQWQPASEHWYTATRNPLDRLVEATGEVNKDPLQGVPADALFSDGGVIIASLRMGTIGSGGHDDGELDDFFAKNRERQKMEKKFLLLKWMPSDCLNTSEWPDVTDPYGDPYVLHDAQGTLDALNRTIERKLKENDGVLYTIDRRYSMLKAILVPFIAGWPNPAVVTRGY